MRGASTTATAPAVPQSKQVAAFYFSLFLRLYRDRATSTGSFRQLPLYAILPSPLQRFLLFVHRFLLLPTTTGGSSSSNPDRGKNANTSNLLTDFLFRGPLHAVKCAVLRGRIFAFCAQLALVSVVAFPREILQLVLPLLEQSVEAHVKSYLVDFFHTSPWASNVVSRNLFRVGNRVFATLRRLAERSAAAVEGRLLSIKSRSFGFLDLSSSSADRWRNLQLVFASTTVFAALSLDLVLNVLNHCFQARRTLEGGRVRWRGFVVGNPDRIELLRNVFLSLAFVCGGAGTVLVKWAFSSFVFFDREEKKEENEVSMGNEEPRFGGGQGGKDRKKADHGDGEHSHRQNDPAIRTASARGDRGVDEAEGFLSPQSDGDGDLESSESFVDVVEPIDPLRTALAVVSTCMGSVISLETARLLFDDVLGFGGDAARANLRDFAVLGVVAGEEAANAEVLEGYARESGKCWEGGDHVAVHLSGHEHGRGDGDGGGAQRIETQQSEAQTTWAAQFHASAAVAETTKVADLDKFVEVSQAFERINERRKILNIPIVPVKWNNEEDQAIPPRSKL